MGILPDWMIERDVKIEPFSPQQDRPGVISFGVTSYGYDVRVGYKWKVFDAIAGGVVDPKNFDPKLLREFDLSPECPACDGHGSKMYEWGVAAMKACGGKRVPFSDGRPGFYYVDDKGREMGLKTIGGPCGECKGTKKNKDASDFITIPPNSYVLGESMETFRIPRDVAVICVGKSTMARCGIIVNVTPGEPEWEGKWTIEISNSSPLPARVYCGEGIMQCMFIRSDGYREAYAKATDLLMCAVDITDAQYMPIKEAAEVDPTCKTSYKDKKGKYQNQGGLTLPKVEK